MSGDGALAHAYRECLPILDAQKAAGVPFAERIKGLDAVLRQFWPLTREWHYLCASCGDYGLEMAVCPGETTCGRRFPHLAHDYGRPCWCVVGLRFQAKARTETTAIEAAARVKKAPTRFGR